MNFITDQNQASQFLRTLWGSDQVIAFISVKSAEPFRNTSVSTVAEAVQIALAEAAEGHDVYMSCAQFKNHDNREAVNAAFANGFWIDLDCGEVKAAEGKGYATKKDASAALKQFVRDMGLPAPTVIESGNGLHSYWLCVEAIPADIWKPQAKKLKALTHCHGLLADDNRTADMASVLRVPGTFNFKDASNPKPVKVARLSTVTPTSELLATLEAAYVAAGCPKTVADRAKLELGTAAADPAQVSQLADLIAAKYPELWGGDWERKAINDVLFDQPRPDFVDQAFTGYGDRTVTSPPPPLSLRSCTQCRKSTFRPVSGNFSI